MDKYVTWFDFMKICNEIFEKICEDSGKEHEIMLDTLKSTNHAIINRINKDYYKYTRLESYIVGMFEAAGFGSRENYKKWCEEFDKLNKPKDQEEQDEVQKL